MAVAFREVLYLVYSHNKCHSNFCCTVTCLSVPDRLRIRVNQMCIVTKSCSILPRSLTTLFQDINWDPYSSEYQVQILPVFYIKCHLQLALKLRSWLEAQSGSLLLLMQSVQECTTGSQRQCKQKQV